MIEHDETVAVADDGFEQYFTEKIWEWIPPIYRDEDGKALAPDVLRSLVQILAGQTAQARRSIDRLWEDPYIESCDDWAISYIGDLLGTRLVHPLNRRGRRADVARTIFYRRRNGTPLVLELLIRDIAGWEGVVVESFRRLARTRHGLDIEPDTLNGPVTGTPPGGWADLRSVRTAQQIDGPFDEFSHTADVRQLRGKLGRYGIPKLNFHLYRQYPYEVNFVTPFDLGGNRFTFDPSGRDIALFSPDQRPTPDQWRRPSEWEMPAPIPCRLLGAAKYVISMDTIDDLTNLGLGLDAADQLSRYAGIEFHNDSRLRVTIASLPTGIEILSLIDALLARSITDDSPKARLVPSPVQRDPSAVAVALGSGVDSLPVEHQRIAAGNLEDWGTSLANLPTEKHLVIDPERARFWFVGPEVSPAQVWVPLHHYGLAGDVGAGPYDRREFVLPADLILPNGGDADPGPVAMAIPVLGGSNRVIQVDDSKTYEPDDDLVDIEQLTLQAANQERPFLRRVLPATQNQWLFAARPKPAVPADGLSPAADARELTLEGLWIGLRFREEESSTPPCDPVPMSLVLDGVFDRVVIRHCTLDPGGEQARVDAALCTAIPFVSIVVRGQVEELVIESSIVGPILEDHSAGENGVIQKLTVRNSIIHSIDSSGSPAVSTNLGEVHLDKTTVLGALQVNRLYASDSLIQGRIQVTDNQHGCFRFSATNDEPLVRLPQQYESHLVAPAIPNHYFVSRRFGDAGYGQLGENAPPQIGRGAENTDQMGAFNHQLSEIKRDDLAAKVAEFMPFGLIPQFVNET